MGTIVSIDTHLARKRDDIRALCSAGFTALPRGNHVTLLDDTTISVVRVFRKMVQLTYIAKNNLHYQDICASEEFTADLLAKARQRVLDQGHSLASDDILAKL